MKYISFASTAPKIKEQTKDVTRRPTTRKPWKRNRFNVGEVVQAYDRLPARDGKPIAKIRIKDISKVPLNSITMDEMSREGMPGGSIAQFINTWMLAYDGPEDQLVWRIEFEYVTKKLGRKPKKKGAKRGGRKRGKTH
jgi:hypothetical protein